MKKLLLVVWILSGCSSNAPPESTLSDSEKQCRYNGIFYFKDIGSWPRLSTGEFATDVVNLRCQISSGQFKAPKCETSERENTLRMFKDDTAAIARFKQHWAEMDSEYHPCK